MTTATPSEHRHDESPSGLAWLEQGEGDLVVCQHGFPDSMWSFETLLGDLAAAGHRAIAPSLRGYVPGAPVPSSRPTLLHAARSILALVDHLDAERFSVVGHDWGSAVAHVLGVVAPDRATRLVTAGVPHIGHFLAPRPRQLWSSRYMAQFQVPGIPERVASARDGAWIDRLARRWSPTWDPTPGQLAVLRRGIETEDGLRAGLGYYRALVPSLLDREQRRIFFSDIPVPTRSVRGRVDQGVLATTFDGQARHYAGGFDQAEIDCGHFLHLEAPDEFARLVLEHLAA